MAGKVGGQLLTQSSFFFCHRAPTRLCHVCCPSNTTLIGPAGHGQTPLRHWMKTHPCSYHCSFQVFVSDKNQHGCGRVLGVLLEECGNLESSFKICTVLIQSFWIWNVLCGPIDSVLQQGGAKYMWRCKVQTFQSARNIKGNVKIKFHYL